MFRSYGSWWSRTSVSRPHAPPQMRKAMSASVIESKKAPVSTQMLTYWMFVINAQIPPKTKVLDPRFLPSFHPLEASEIESKKASASEMLTCGMFVVNARILLKTKVLDPRFLPSFHPLVAFTSQASRAAWTLDTTPIGYLRPCRELVSLYNGISARR